MSRFSVDRDGNITERPQTPAERRDFLLYYARVLLREARARRRQGRHGFDHTLLDWAGNARREAAAIDLTPAQGVLL